MQVNKEYSNGGHFGIRCRKHHKLQRNTQRCQLQIKFYYILVHYSCIMQQKSQWVDLTKVNRLPNLFCGHSRSKKQVKTLYNKFCQASQPFLSIFNWSYGQTPQLSRCQSLSLCLWGLHMDIYQLWSGRF